MPSAARPHDRHVPGLCMASDGMVHAHTSHTSRLWKVTDMSFQLARLLPVGLDAANGSQVPEQTTSTWPMHDFNWSST